MEGGLRVALDAMGGDYAPVATVEGAISAMQNEKLHITLVGKPEAIQAELSKFSYDKNRLTIVPATQVISMDEHPTAAIKEKKDSSMVVGLRLLKEGQADAFVSAGNTGALLAGATTIVGRIKGIERPALATLLPNEKGFSFLIDSGANVDAKPTYLVQFGKMGSVYMEHVMGIPDPRVGLVNIGAEKEKGNALVKEAYELMREAGFHFIGNVEARDIPAGAADVLVCDAFIGNILLKYSEGFSVGLLRMVRKELMGTLLSKLGALLAAGAFKNLKKSFDFSEIGGAPFLGLNALVVKAHGSSNAKAFKNAIKKAMEFYETGVIDLIAAAIK